MRNILIILALIVTLVLSASVILYLQSEKRDMTASELLIGERYREIEGSGGFVNTNGTPVTIGEHLGKKIVLLEFISYSCVNCQRSFPHIAGWYEKYKDKGLVVIGIHTPEFAFEHDIKNVEAAMEKSGVTFPVVLDNEYRTWNAYGNHYWPRTFLIDTEGTIVYDHIGVGDYEAIENEIKKLLN
jgi:thiol-disulfide isomerase/thioredoxin